MMRLKIAIQKSGRLYEESVKLLKECGIDFNNSMNKLRTEATNFPLEILFLRDDDIPQYVADKVAAIGIVGENVIAEKKQKVKIMEQLGFGKCRLSIAVPKDKKYEGLKSLNGKRIATSYSHVLTAFLKKNKIKAEIHDISGSVEIAPGIG
ncbi:MAG: ATP phosphoribosyltransferase, partial [Bacteroidia bacterium]|nr:ATP phosphoribosyltransferase [Bacteroidia bacterium]